MATTKAGLGANCRIATWAKATTRIPQIIAHRGYKAKYVENSIPAMRAAVEAGANALETDVHLTADGVVVLSHVSDD